MADSHQNAVARQVDLALAGLESLSTPPATAAQLVGHVVDGRMGAAAEIIEADPALSAHVLSLAHRHRVSFREGIASVSESVSKLPAAVVREAVLSARLCDVQDTGDAAVSRRQMATYCLGVACAAREIAEFVLPEHERPPAFTAGLLCELGRLALDEVMPKGYSRVVEEARRRQVCAAVVEREQLGLDHTVVGRRLARKWALPQEVEVSIWLQNSDIEAVAERMPAAKVALVVRLASILTRQCGIGANGDFDVPVADDGLLGAVGVSREQTDRIRAQLPDKTAEKVRLLGLDIGAPVASYCEAMRLAAARLSRDNAAAADRISRLAMDSSQLQFLHDFAVAVTPEMSAVETAQLFVTTFQKHYQTGAACLYLVNGPEDRCLDMVGVDETGRVVRQLLTVPGGAEAIGAELAAGFGLFDVCDCVPWLIEAIEIDVAGAKVVPLAACGRPVGALIFNQRVPVEARLLTSLLSVSATVAAHVIAVKLTGQRQSEIAEQFAELLGCARQTRTDMASAGALAGLAELASGAAHELNNPLAVISGRVQLMLQVETDPDKRQILTQIQQRTEEISEIITDLMRFARPAAPAIRRVSLRAVLDKAARQTAERFGRSSIEIEWVGVDDGLEVEVDPDQVASAVANVMTNALESYKGESGPIRIEAAAGDKTVTVRVIDRGRGISAETAGRAFDPFFSELAAGRKRGMGLAHARRLIGLSKGAISLASQPGVGTTVSITLPKA